MSAWTKESDWLPLSNAIAIAQFYLDNVKKAQRHLEYVESFAAYNLSGYQSMWSKAKKFLDDMKDALEEAQQKLEETQERVNPPS